MNHWQQIHQNRFGRTNTNCPALNRHTDHRCCHVTFVTLKSVAVASRDTHRNRTSRRMPSYDYIWPWRTTNKKKKVLEKGSWSIPPFNPLGLRCYYTNMYSFFLFYGHSIVRASQKMKEKYFSKTKAVGANVNKYTIMTSFMGCQKYRLPRTNFISLGALRSMLSACARRAS